MPLAPRKKRGFKIHTSGISTTHETGRSIGRHAALMALEAEKEVKALHTSHKKRLKISRQQENTAFETSRDGDDYECDHGVDYGRNSDYPGDTSAPEDDDSADDEDDPSRARPLENGISESENSIREKLKHQYWTDVVPRLSKTRLWGQPWRCERFHQKKKKDVECISHNGISLFDIYVSILIFGSN